MSGRPPVNLQSRDEDILETLSARVRVLSVRQIADTWWPEAANGVSAASERLSKLVRADHLVALERPIRPVDLQGSPLARWAPGDPVPDFGRLSYLGRSRSPAPAQPTKLFHATPQTAARLVGAKPPPLRLGELRHELGLSSVYLWLRSTCPEEAATWTPDWRIPQPRRHFAEKPEKRPDAVISRTGRPLVVEYVGHYVRSKLESLHEYCRDNELPYELW